MWISFRIAIVISSSLAGLISEDAKATEPVSDSQFVHERLFSNQNFNSLEENDRQVILVNSGGTPGTPPSPVSSPLNRSGNAFSPNYIPSRPWGLDRSVPRSPPKSYPYKTPYKMGDPRLEAGKNPHNQRTHFKLNDQGLGAGAGGSPAWSSSSRWSRADGTAGSSRV